MLAFGGMTEEALALERALKARKSGILDRARNQHLSPGRRPGFFAEPVLSEVEGL